MPAHPHNGLPPVTFVLGGARSGKSAFALSLFEGCSRRVYLATATAEDGEMETRIRKHQVERGENWRTVEEPLELAMTLSDLAAGGDPILVDCLTLWLGNLVAAERELTSAADGLVDQLRRTSTPIVLVSNEVGLGIVPASAMGRQFRDEAGRLHQRIASIAQWVVFLAAGLPLTLKDERS